MSCGSRFYSVRSLMSHMELNHAQDSLLHFICSLDGCSKVYNNVVAYRKHLSRAHYSHWNLSALQREMPVNVDDTVAHSLDVQSPNAAGTIAEPNCSELSAEGNDNGIDDDVNDFGLNDISQIKQEIGQGIGILENQRSS
jgi:hypothetical protein